ncbi:MAG: hypothetical protein KH616_23430, partial [Burkholderia sp.]|nr:hypothetical protein [Burkholderia sp.]
MAISSTGGQRLHIVSGRIMRRGVQKRDVRVHIAPCHGQAAGNLRYDRRSAGMTRGDRTMREVRWASLEGDGIEHLTFDRDDDRIVVESAVVGQRRELEHQHAG